MRLTFSITTRIRYKKPAGCTRWLSTSTMSPALLNSESNQTSAPVKPSSILHRTLWKPPIAVSAEGSYITLDSGKKLLDAVGGAAVACIGNGHPKVTQAIKDQVDKVSCRLICISFHYANHNARRRVQHATIESTGGGIGQALGRQLQWRFRIVRLRIRR